MSQRCEVVETSCDALALFTLTPLARFGYVANVMSDLDKSHAVRLDAATAERVEALRPRYNIPGREAKTSDVLRALILAGLQIEEERTDQQQPKRAKR